MNPIRTLIFMFKSIVNRKELNIGTILSSKRIGRGIFGKIDKVKTRFKGKITSRNREFVIKTFEKEKYRDDSYENWLKIKTLGVPTFITYRKYGTRQIIMTNLSNNEEFCISTNKNSTDAKQIKKMKIKEIENFEDLKKSLQNIADIGKKNGLVFSSDSIFFIGNRSKKTRIRAFLGDLDGIYTPQTLGTNIYYSVFFAYYFFIKIYVDETNKAKYELTLLEEKFTSP